MLFTQRGVQKVQKNVTPRVNWGRGLTGGQARLIAMGTGISATLEITLANSVTMRTLCILLTNSTSGRIKSILTELRSMKGTR